MVSYLVIHLHHQNVYHICEDSELDDKTFQRVFGFLMQDDSKVDVAASYPLSEFKAALTAYEKAGKNGKILLVSE